jgi:hypothetical protein
MKNKLFLLGALFIGLVSNAQEEGDTTRFKIGNKEIIIIGSDTMMVDVEGDDSKGKPGRYGGDLTYWGGFDIGINMPLNGSSQTTFNSQHLQIDPIKSLSYSFNFGEQRIRIIKDYFGIVTGVGFTNSRYGFKNESLRLESNIDSTFGYVDTNLFTGFSKNQLRINSFNIPILFQINTSKNEDKNFHISFGAIGGVRIGSNVKYKYDFENGEDTKNKERGRYNLNAFQLMATARLGYKDYGLFVNYNILTMYETGKSETAYPLTFGASFHF